jgi:hypothetical protein
LEVKNQAVGDELDSVEQDDDPICRTEKSENHHKRSFSVNRLMNLLGGWRWHGWKVVYIK